jgi:hypothetical protein
MAVVGLIKMKPIFPVAAKFRINILEKLALLVRVVFCHFVYFKANINSVLLSKTLLTSLMSLKSIFTVSLSFLELLCKFSALRVGTVPVVWGAPNIEQFDPLYQTKHDFKSMVHANNLSPAELAKHLNSLMLNETAYEELLAWKHLGIGEQFRWLLSQRYSHEGACIMCKAVAYIKKMESINSS